MTQPITTRGGWKARLGQIADAYPQAAGLLLSLIHISEPTRPY